MNEGAERSCVLVEDNPDHADLIRIALKKNGSIGIQHIFTSGEEALAYLRRAETAPDILFIDVNLPEMNGFEFIRNIKAELHLPDTKIVILTTSDADRDRHQALELKVDSYLLKPLRQEAIQQLLSQS